MSRCQWLARRETRPFCSLISKLDPPLRFPVLTCFSFTTFSSCSRKREHGALEVTDDDGVTCHRIHHGYMHRISFRYGAQSRRPFAQTFVTQAPARCEPHNWSKTFLVQHVGRIVHRQVQACPSPTDLIPSNVVGLQLTRWPNRQVTEARPFEGLRPPVPSK